LHGTQEYYHTFDRIGGRFNSEIGMEAFPALSTICHFVTKISELNSHSRTLDFHKKADGHACRIALDLAENFPATAGLKVSIPN
jgi:beta-mannosidase